MSMLSPALTDAEWLTQTWMPTVVSPSSRCPCAAHRHVFSIRPIIEGVDSTGDGKCGGDMLSSTRWCERPRMPVVKVSFIEWTRLQAVVGGGGGGHAVQ